MGDFYSPSVGDEVMVVGQDTTGRLVVHGGDYTFTRRGGMGWLARFEPVEVQHAGRSYRLLSPRHCLIEVSRLRGRNLQDPVVEQIIISHLRKKEDGSC